MARAARMAFPDQGRGGRPGLGTKGERQETDMARGAEGRLPAKPPAAWCSQRSMKAAPATRRQITAAISSASRVHWGSWPPRLRFPTRASGESCAARRDRPAASRAR